MSEDRLTIIERKVDELMVGQAELRANVGELTAGQAKLTSGYSDLVSGQATLVAGQATLAATVDELSTGQAKLRTEMQAGDAALRADMKDLGHQMRLLHEHTIKEIKALAPDFAPIRSEFKAADAKLMEDIDRRLTPLEAWARDLSKRLADRPEDE
jgi:hypothetical protein